MREAMRQRWGWLWVVMLAWAQAAAAAEAPSMTVQQVSPHAYFVQGLSALGSTDNQNFISNAGFVVTPKGVVVIDALGSPALAQRLLQEIARITPMPVTHVLVTHYHADHIYGLQTFKAAGARIVAHRAALTYLHSDTAQLRLRASRQDLAPWIDDDTRLVEADQWLDGDADIDVGGVRFEFKHVGPAHTPEDAVVYLPAEQVLFAGDLVFRGRVPFVGQADSGRWVAALDQMLAYPAQVVVPGHGPLSRQARQDMALTRDYLTYLRTSMGQAAQDMVPFEDAYARTDWSAFEHLPLFRVANRMNAYNTYLLLEHQAQ